MSAPVTLHYTRDLRAAWPHPLVELWHRSYPQLFDDDDVRLTRRQPNYHFVEWLAAIHLFHMHGAHSLLKKYAFTSHARKCSVIDRVLGPAQRQFLQRKLEGQAPDLFVFYPDASEFWFAEVKGPRDRLTTSQLRNHAVLRRRFGVRVDVVQLKQT